MQQIQSIHPLSPENIRTIVELCGNYIRERYETNLSEETLYKVLTNIHKKNLEYFRANPPIPPLDDLNKRAIAEVRDFVIEQKRKALPQQQQQQQLSELFQGRQPPPQPPASESGRSTSVQQNQQQMKQLQQVQYQEREDIYMQPPMNSPQQQPSHPQQLQQPQSYDSQFALVDNQSPQISQIQIPTLESIQDEKNEDDFFTKLQNLEMQRGTQINLQQPPVNSPIVSSTANTVLPPTHPTNTIIYMSNTPNADVRNTKPVVLCSANRMWVHIVDRNLMVFGGPLPDSMNIRLSRLMLPKRVAHNTPCVNVHIKSATDKTMEVMCQLDKEGPVWDIWKPISVSLSLIKTFACPWTLTLHDIFNRPLEMGQDANRITSVVKLMNGNTKITIDPETDVRPFGQIILHNDGVDTYLNTVHVIQPHTIELPGDQSHIKINESYICNLQAQAYIVLEMEKRLADEDITESV